MMSNPLQTLINKLCPNGVEFKPLWEITIWDKKFKKVPKHWQSEIKRFKHISANKLKSLLDSKGNIKLLSTGNFDGYTTHEKAKDFINNGEVISIPSGGSAKIKYYNGQFVDSGNILAISKDNKKQNFKFIFYALVCNIDFIESSFQGSGVAHPDMQRILSLPIPLPPLEIQHRIVEILDTFAELEKELEKELSARKKQYEHYRNALLSFDSLQTITDKFTGGGAKVKMCSLEELFHIRNGYTPSKANKAYWENGTIPWFRMEDIRKNGRILSDSIQHITPEAVKGKGLIPANSMIIATTATIGEHALIIVDSLVNQRFTCLTPQVNCCILNMKYFYYYGFILGEWCLNNVNVSGFASVDMKKFKSLQIPLPPLEVQNEIVEILDRFDAMVSSITEGLPAEIQARKKQYAYYRDRLLSFEAN